MVVPNLPATILPPFARWPLPLFIVPACIFNPISPPALSFSRWRGRICLLLHAGRCRSSLRRRAFLISFLHRRYRLHCGVDEFAAFCTLAAAVLCFAGVHFLFCFSAGAIVFTVAWTNLPPFARWPLPFFASPACIFILFLRRRYRLHGGVDEFAAFCPLAAAVLCFAGVHF